MIKSSRKIIVRVLPRSSKNEVVPLGDGAFRVKLTAPPVDGKANEALIKLLSEHFDVPKWKIRIVRGEKGSKKVIDLSE